MYQLYGQINRDTWRKNEQLWRCIGTPWPAASRSSNQDQSRTQAQTQTQNQGSAPQPQPGGWLRRLFHQEEVPPPPAPKPPGVDDTFKMGAWDGAKVGNRTLEQIANTMYNENRGLRGGDSKSGFAGQEQLDKGSLAIGHAIINASRKDAKREYVARSTVPDQDKQSAIYQHYLDLARQALREDYNGVDPVGGRTQFNHRFNSDRGPRRTTGRPENLFQDFGPFDNAGSKINRSARIVIYDDAQPAPPPRPNTRRQHR
jgi:hypothetical protein